MKASLSWGGGWGRKPLNLLSPTLYLFYSNKGFIMCKYALASSVALMRFVHFGLIFLIRQSANHRSWVCSVSSRLQSFNPDSA